MQSYVDMRSLIDKALKHVNIIWESLILCKHIIVLDIKGADNVKPFFDTPIVEIPTNKGANSEKYQFSKILNYLINPLIIIPRPICLLRR